MFGMTLTFPSNFTLNIATRSTQNNYPKLPYPNLTLTTPNHTLTLIDAVVQVQIDFFGSNGHAAALD